MKARRHQRRQKKSERKAGGEDTSSASADTTDSEESAVSHNSLHAPPPENSHKPSLPPPPPPLQPRLQAPLGPQATPPLVAPLLKTVETFTATPSPPDTYTTEMPRNIDQQLSQQ